MSRFKKISRSLSIATLALAFTAAVHAQVELITNGDFSGGLTNWTTSVSTSGSVSGTCGYNAGAAPGTETLTGTAGFPSVTGTQVALGSVSLTAIGFRSCVLYQDITIPVGATTATISADLAIKLIGGGGNGNTAIYLGIYSTATVPNFQQATLVGTSISILGANNALVPQGPVAINVSGVAGTTVRLAFINAIQSNFTGTGPFVAGANTIVGANNVHFRVTAPVASVASVPTVSEWGLILLSAVIALFGVLQVRRLRG